VPTPLNGSPLSGGYAGREGIDVAAFTERLGPPLTPDQVGQAIVDLASGTGRAPGAYQLSSGGLAQLG
jgi:hypothetical protein